MSVPYMKWIYAVAYSFWILQRIGWRGLHTLVSDVLLRVFRTAINNIAVLQLCWVRKCWFRSWKRRQDEWSINIPVFLIPGTSNGNHSLSDGTFQINQILHWLYWKIVPCHTNMTARLLKRTKYVLSTVKLRLKSYTNIALRRVPLEQVYLKLHWIKRTLLAGTLRGIITTMFGEWTDTWIVLRESQLPLHTEEERNSLNVYHGQNSLRTGFQCDCRRCGTWVICLRKTSTTSAENFPRFRTRQYLQPKKLIRHLQITSQSVLLS